MSTALHGETVDRNEAWKMRGLCRGHTDPDMWFPDSVKRAASAPAQAICTNCPVTRECLAYATTHRIAYGVWGGKRQSDRPFGLSYRRDRAYW